MHSTSVAIIGGGVSGLGAAYYLWQTVQRSGRPLHIRLYEQKNQLGGNADTVVVQLGELQTGAGQAVPYFRWADLGVNDVNLTAYQRLKAVMEQIGFLDNMKPLQDTESYASSDLRVALTDDKYLCDGVTDPTFNLAAADQGRLAQLIQVVHRTALNTLSEFEQQAQDRLDYTVGRFFQDCLDDPQALLSKAAQELKIKLDWADPVLPARLQRVRDEIYYPRISAMYFTDDQGPAGMPLQAPFEYYRVQEGGNEAPDRRYFDHGSQTWLEALAAFLLAQNGPHFRFELVTGAAATVRVAQPGQAMVHVGEKAIPADWVVMATHADDALKGLSFGDTLHQYGQQIKSILSSVRYTDSYAVAHTHAARLPANRALWRTYNIHVRDAGDSLFPYRIDYVANLHQNDPLNPRYDRAGLPQFFVSLVDDLNLIPRQHMLDRVLDSASIPADMLAALPQATRRQLEGILEPSAYRVSDPANDLQQKAWTTFKHNVLDAQCIRAQRAMLAHNQRVAAQLEHSQRPAVPVLFSGGWTHGAGLQEQCLAQAELIAQWLSPLLR
ncbi:NAD(P)-binding protein [Chitinibacter sp. ZOR0017]|uniref:NAD(P)-binding protein n=1 Tax=Chitinibacter sp. ZOR0017 TaxID=1339254 RepID=UPI00068BA2A3|nr:NAD(P)-binding protein [Chitinibacter sp. ZOR0017]